MVVVRPHRRLSALLALAIGLLLFIGLQYQPGAAADQQLAAGETRFLSFTVNRSTIPSWVTYRELTYRVYVGVAGSVSASGDGHSVPVRYDAASGKATFTTDATSISLVLTNSTSPAASIGQIEVTVLRDDKRWALSMTFDDGYYSQYTSARSYLEKYGYKGGIAINGRALDNPAFGGKQYMNDAQMRDIFASGWSIFNHSYSHWFVSDFPNTTYALADVKRGLDRIVAGGVTTPTVFVAPYVDAAYWDLLRQSDNNYYSIYTYQGGWASIMVPDDMTAAPYGIQTVGRDSFDYTGSYMSQAHTYAVANPNKHFWLFQSTHTIDAGCDPVETSVDFLYANYGKGGTDEVWVAPIDKVSQYLMARRTVSLPGAATGNADRPVIMDAGILPAYVLANGSQVILVVAVADPQGLGNVSSVQADLSTLASRRIPFCMMMGHTATGRQAMASMASPSLYRLGQAWVRRAWRWACKMPRGTPRWLRQS